MSIRITCSAFGDVESLKTYTSRAPRKMSSRVLHLCLPCTDTHCERAQSVCACIAVSRGGAGPPPPLPLARAGTTGEPDAVIVVDRRGFDDEELEVDDADENDEAESDRDRGAATASVQVLTGRATATTLSGKEESEAERSRSRLTDSTRPSSRPGLCEVSVDRKNPFVSSRDGMAVNIDSLFETRDPISDTDLEDLQRRGGTGIAGSSSSQ